MSTGMVFYYVLLQLPLWWFFHAIISYWKYKSARWSTTRRSTIVHVSMLIVAIVVPSLFIMMVQFKGGYGLARFPPILCTGKSANSTFYYVVIPIIILLEGGVMMYLLVIWKVIHKVSVVGST